MEWQTVWNGKPVGCHLAKQVVFLIIRKLGDNVLVGVIKPAKAERQLGDGQVKPNQTFLPGSLDARIGRAQAECQLRIN
jgi:hypothetical protein